MPVSLAMEGSTVDMSVPPNIALAELVPAMVKALGPLDSGTATRGFTVRTSDGHALNQARTLPDQQVRPGAVLTIEPMGTNAQDQRYDDLIEAVGTAVADNSTPWKKTNSVQLSAHASAALVLLAALLLVTGTREPILTAAAGISGALLTTLATAVVARMPDRPGALSLGHTTPVLIACAAFAITPGDWYTLPLATAGTGLLIGSATLLVLPAELSISMAAPTTAGISFCVVGLLVHLMNLHPDRAGSLVMALLVVITLSAPWVALARLPVTINTDGEDERIDPTQVYSHVGGARVLVISLKAGCSAAMVVLSPLLTTTPTTVALLADALHAVAAVAGGGAHRRAHGHVPDHFRRHLDHEGHPLGPALDPRHDHPGSGPAVGDQRGVAEVAPLADPTGGRGRDPGPAGDPAADRPGLGSSLMPSNKEILEAQRYNRRRLIAAFTSGIPGGRELESKSPFVPLIVGSVVVAIMLGVGVVMSRFAPTLPQDWQDSTLIIVKSTGARYYTIHGVLRPVTNVTSARLMSEAGKYRPSEVSDSTIDGISRGSQVGITGVPDDVPEAGKLHSDQWFSCDISGKPHTWVAQVPAARTARGNALVKTQEGDLFLITNGLRHKIPSGQTPNPLYALGLDSVAPVTVSSQWLSLFEPGTDLKFLELEGAGQPVSGMPPSLSAASIGSVIEVKSGDSTRRYVVIGDNKATQLTNLTDKLYTSGTILNATLADISKIDIVDIDAAGIAPADWPKSIDNTMPAGSLPCAQLAKGSGDSSTSVLYSMTRQELTEALPKTQDADKNTDAGSQPPTPTSVRGGSGALIRTTSGGSLGVVALVSDLGTLHGIGSPADDTLKRLGYDENTVVYDVPAAWAALIPEGETLDPGKVWDTVKEQ